MFLRCRHAAKIRFIKLRSDVLVKLQLLDNKRGECYVHVLCMANERCDVFEHFEAILLSLSEFHSTWTYIQCRLLYRM